MPRTAARADAPLWPGEPFGDSALGDLTGRVEFTASRATLTPSLVLRQLRGVLRVKPGETAIENIEGVLAGGRVSGQLVLARATDGSACRRGLRLPAAMPRALLPGEGKAPVQGRIALQAEVEGAGSAPLR